MKDPQSPSVDYGSTCCCRASGWLARHLTRLSRPQVREARLMCCVEHTSQLCKFGDRVIMWPVSTVVHPRRLPSASCRASGWLERHLARLSRPQVRKARLMCCVEHTSQLGKFGARVVMWPGSKGNLNVKIGKLNKKNSEPGLPARLERNSYYSN